jgi:long-chain acyl-CoA synthetase
MYFASLPDRRADQDPHGPAVSDGRLALTNAELLDRIRAASHQLRELGIGAGDVLAVKLPNRVEFVVLLFASWRLGATVTPVNPSLSDGEVVRQLNDSGARLLVVEDGAAMMHGVTTLAIADLADEPVAADPPPHLDSSALALLIYTSGTTGAPKGVMLDHANIDAMADMGRRALQIGPADRCLLILPLFHVNGIVVSVLTPLLAGASLVIADRFNPRTFFDVVESERPTFFSAVPTIYTMLAALPEDVVPDTSSVRFGICGAAPAPAELLTRFEARYGFPLSRGTGSRRGPVPPPSIRSRVLGVPEPRGLRSRGSRFGLSTSAGSRCHRVWTVRSSSPAPMSCAAISGVRTKRPESSSTAGCTPATSATSTKTAT